MFDLVSGKITPSSPEIQLGDLVVFECNSASKPLWYHFSRRIQHTDALEVVVDPTNVGVYECRGTTENNHTFYSLTHLTGYGNVLLESTFINDNWCTK